MDENKKYHNPDDGINNESDNDTYDPYEEYVKDKVHEEQKKSWQKLLYHQKKVWKAQKMHF